MRLVLTWLCVLFLTLGTLGCGSDPEDNPEFQDTAADPSLVENPSATTLPGEKAPPTAPTNP